MMSQVTLNVSIPDPKKFRRALAQAEQAGLKITQSFQDLGVASGTIDQHLVAKIERIDGIESVEADRDVTALG
jgi:hypothetical protein